MQCAAARQRAAAQCAWASRTRPTLSLKRAGVSIRFFVLWPVSFFPGNREEGKGVGGPGEGTLGPDGPFPRRPASCLGFANCTGLAAMNGVVTNYPLRARGGAAEALPRAAQHGCAAIEGTNYERVSPERIPWTIGWRVSFERTDCSSPAAQQLPPGRAARLAWGEGISR